MQQDQINLLTTHEFYVIKAKKSKRPYLDASCCCYLFETEKDASAFSEVLLSKGVSVYFDNREYLKQVTFATFLYSIGCKGIKIRERNKKKFQLIPITIEDTKKSVFFVSVNRSLNRYLVTGKRKYLTRMLNESFLIPARVEQRLKKQYPKIGYVCLSMSKKGRFDVLFTTLEEFNDWNMTQNDQYKPLLIKFTMFNDIRKKNHDNIIINPLSDKLLFTDYQIEQLYAKGGIGVHEEKSA